MYDSIEQVVDAHAKYLANGFGNPSWQLKSFVNRLKSDPESARAEAVIFAWLKRLRKRPSINEQAGAGGMDFRCDPEAGGNLLVEVTVLGKETLSIASGLSAESPGWFRMITRELKSRVSAKMDQLSREERFPRVLAICSEHPLADNVFNRVGALHLLVSDPQIAASHSDHSGPASLVTDLKHSVFFKWSEDDPKRLIPCRRSASAVLLISILSDRTKAYGVVHPEPQIPLDLNSLPEVPMLRILNWPPTNGKIVTEWTLETDPPFPGHKRITKDRPFFKIASQKSK